MDHFPMLVAEHLKLNVPRMFQEFFRVNVRRAKSLLRLAARRLVRRQKLFLFTHHAHSAAASASAGGGLQNGLVSDPVSDFRHLLFPVLNPVATPSSRRA